MRITRTMGLTASIVLCSLSPAMSRDFRLEEYFAGHTVAVGHFGAINGISRSFKVDLLGRWNGKVFSLQEDFRYADGEKDRKTWRFNRTAPGVYTGTREDVVGDAKVTIDGDTARKTYLVDIAPGPKENIVRFHDTIKRQPDGSLLNTAWVSKYGFPVATVRVVFAKR